nr:uncharacterized protein LOC112025336 isoform X2 [Quercus suber]XP_023913766.1 uncharacterized protein LOC112025336 isoform X2 [Quercus suber]
MLGKREKLSQGGGCAARANASKEFEEGVAEISHSKRQRVDLDSKQQCVCNTEPSHDLHNVSLPVDGQVESATTREKGKIEGLRWELKPDGRDCQPRAPYQSSDLSGDPEKYKSLLATIPNTNLIVVNFTIGEKIIVSTSFVEIPQTTNVASECLLSSSSLIL